MKLLIKEQHQSYENAKICYICKEKFKNDVMTYLIKYVFQVKQHLDLIVFNMVTGINDLKRLTKHISCECKCRFGERECNSDQWWNNNKG